MLLSEFLNYFDFDYKIVDGQMRFVDLQGANLGDIEEERWCLGKNFFACVVDRMHIYINDYVISDIEEALQKAGVENADSLDLEDLVKEADARDVWYDKEIVVEGTAADKAMLLLQLKGLEPEFFEKISKPKLSDTISFAEEQKGVVSPGGKFLIDKEGNER